MALSYRVDIFGFPNLTAIGNASANVGLRDQRLALEWLRDNVRAFGGDPARMVPLGYSAGASSLGVARVAHTRPPIVRGMLLMSGTPTVINIPTNTGSSGRVDTNAGSVLRPKRRKHGYSSCCCYLQLIMTPLGSAGAINASGCGIQK